MTLKGTKKAKLSDSKSLRVHNEESSGSSDSSPEATTTVDNKSDSDSDDEVVEDADTSSSSGSEDELEGESENESDDNAVEASEPKRVKKGDGFGTAMDAILGSRVKAHNAADPILIRNKRTAKEIEEARSEAKAKRALRAEKQQFKDRAHVPDLVPKDPDAAGQLLQHEKLLRRTAQKGVVKLLNAIHNAQVAASTTEGGTKQDATKQDEISKEKFLDMIRMG